MKFSRFSSAFALAAGSVLLLVSCGGGGGSTTSNSDSNINAVIKSSNAKNVGAQAYWAVDFLNSQINAAVSSVAGAATTDLSSTSCKDPITGIVSGTSRLTVEPDTNTITMVDVNCNGGVWVSNGTTTIKLSNLSGNPYQDSAWQGTLTITFDFHASFDPFILSQTGDLVVEYKQTAPNVGTFLATNTSLQSRLSRLAGGSSAIERTISQLTYTGSIDSSRMNTFGADFTLSGKFGSLGTASYSIKTKTGFKRQISSDEIAGKLSQGAMSVTASDKSLLTLVAIDTTTAKLEVDTNGDNVIDATPTATWDELGTLSNPILMLN